MMSKCYPARRRHKVAAVAQPDSRCAPLIVELKHARSDERGIEAVTESVNTDCCDHEPDGIGVLVTRYRYSGESNRGDRSDRCPEQHPQRLHPNVNLAGVPRRVITGRVAANAARRGRSE